MKRIAICFLMMFCVAMFTGCPTADDAVDANVTAPAEDVVDEDAEPAIDAAPVDTPDVPGELDEPVDEPVDVPDEPAEPVDVPDEPAPVEDPVVPVVDPPVVPDVLPEPVDRPTIE